MVEFCVSPELDAKMRAMYKPEFFENVFEFVKNRTDDRNDLIIVLLSTVQVIMKLKVKQRVLVNIPVMKMRI